MGSRLQEISVLRLKRVRWIHDPAHIAMLLNPAASVNWGATSAKIEDYRAID